MSLRILRLILLVASVLCTSGVSRAQSLPFGDAFLPTLTFTETYTDTVVLGDFGYSQVADGSLSISGRMSMKNVVVSDMFAEGNSVVLNVANLLLNLDLAVAEQSDSGGYHVYTWPLTAISQSTGEELSVGSVVLKYNDTELRLNLTAIHAPSDFTIYAAQEAGSDETLDETGLILSFSVGPYAIEEVICYVKGTASTFDKTVGIGDAAETFYGLAKVNLTGAIDSLFPSVTVDYPPAPFHGVYPTLTERPVTVRGACGDNHGIFSVEVKLNDGVFQPAAIDSGKWSLAGVEFVPGWNKLTVQCTDQDGHVRTVERLAKFSAVSTLTVTAAGNALGRIQSDFFDPLKYDPAATAPVNKTKHADGESLVVTAIPGPNSVFDGWTASKPLTAKQLASPRLSFKHLPNLVLTAKFLINPFAPVKGRYNGLATGSTAEGNGFLSTTLAANGTFTGMLKVGTLKLKLKGNFSNTGHFTKTVTVDGVAYTIDLNLNVSGSGAEQITGTVTGGNVNVSIVAARSTFDRIKNPAPQAGAYNVIIPPAPGQAADFPIGVGFGRVTVSPVGSARFVGRTGTTPAFNAAAQLSANGTWPFFGSLYGNRGSLSGLVTFDLNDPAHDLSGTLNWFKPTNVLNIPVYTNGFSGQSTLLGAKFVKPAVGQRFFLEASSGAGKFSVTAVSDDTRPALQASLDATLGTDNRLSVIVPPGAPISSIVTSVNPLNGQVFGSFLEGATLTKFSALIVGPKLNRAAGYFRRGARTGSIEITAP